MFLFSACFQNCLLGAEARSFTIKGAQTSAPSLTPLQAHPKSLSTHLLFIVVYLCMFQLEGGAHVISCLAGCSQQAMHTQAMKVDHNIQKVETICLWVCFLRSLCVMIGLGLPWPHGKHLRATLQEWITFTFQGTTMSSLVSRCFFHSGHGKQSWLGL